MFGANNIFAVTVFDSIMSRPRNRTTTEDKAVPLNELYPNSRTERAVLNVELSEKPTVPPFYRKVNINRVRTFGAYPTIDNENYTEKLYVADRPKANLDG